MSFDEFLDMLHVPAPYAIRHIASDCFEMYLSQKREIGSSMYIVPV